MAGNKVGIESVTEEIVEKFSEFLTDFYYKELTTAISEGKKSIFVDFSKLDKFDPELADYVLESPSEALHLFDRAVERIDLPGETGLHVRLFNLPESSNIRIRNLRSEHIGKLIAVDGIVKRASDIRPEVSEAIFQCPDCGAQISVIQEERKIKPPVECECGCRKKFRLIGHKLYDARWITIEEPFEITSGERPSDITIFLKEDLTSPKMQNKTDPGNRIKVVGILKEMPRRAKGTASRQMEIYIDANSVESVEVEWEELEITEEDEKKILELAKDPMIYQKLVNSIAPTIYGLDEIKEAIALQMFGGVPKLLKDGTRVRGEIHILLVGDPSCLVADERVVMADGTLMKIGDMGSKHLQKIEYRVHIGMGRKYGRATVFHAYKKQPIIEIITETGKSIKGTYNQPVMVVENTNCWKRLDEVKLGDRVRVLPKIECRKKSLVKTNWVDYPYHHKSWHITVPEFVDENLAAIFGYILADGWVSRHRIGFVVNNDESDIVPKIKEFFKSCFNAPVTSYKRSRARKKIVYQVNRTHIARLLQFLNEKRVPNLIFQSRNSVVASFLRWFYEGDGCVFSKGRGHTSISLKSTSIELLRDVQLLLLRFGIHSRILWEKGRTVKIKDSGRSCNIKSKSSGSLMIERSESIIKFWKNIGFVSKKKNEKLKAAVKYAKTHIHRVNKTLTEKIVKINKLPPQDVFDIEVPKYNRFVANGIIVHNTAKSQLMKLASTMIPRGKYVSGRGVSYAGLTATVVRDEEFLGGWVLEAGAIVLANRSLCCLHPSSNVVFNNSIVPISTIFNEKESEKIICNGKFMQICKLNSSVPSFDIKSYKTSEEIAVLVRRQRYNGKILKMRLNSGFEIKLTPEHQLIDGSRLVWKKARDFKEGEFILAPLKLPSKKGKILIFNLIPDDWKVCLTKKEKNEIKKRVVEKYKSVEEFNKKFSLRKEILNGKCQPSVKQFKQIIDDLKISEMWKNRALKYGSMRFKIWKVTPELGYILGFIAGNGHINRKASHISIRVTIRNKAYIDNFIKNWNKVVPKKLHEKSKNKVLYFGSNLLVLLYDKLIGKKFEKILSLSDECLKAFIAGLFDSAGRISIKFKDRKSNIAHVEFLLSKNGEVNLNLILALRRLDVYSKLVKKKKIDIIQISDQDILYLKNSISKYSKKINIEIPKRLHKVSSISDRLPKFLVAEICKKIVEESTSINEFGLRMVYPYINLKYQPNRCEMEKILNNIGNKISSETRLRIEKLMKRDFFLDKIKKIEFENYSGFVYDLFVPKVHNFVADGVFVHNCIDEFSKINTEDRVALQEAMSLGTVSIAKASIVATLPAQTSILAGGNPKLGRFDPYIPVREQIDVDDVLLSRFDLRFALRDIPSPERDAKMVEYILRMRHFEEEAAKPVINRELLRKYIAYAKKNCRPELTKEAAEEIKKFYLDLREKSLEGPVAITFRQYDSLVRLAEASAKIQLRDKVTVEDAIRAINLMKASLRQFGFEPETGKIDIDRAEGYVTAAQRSKIRTMLDIIDMLSAEYGKEIPWDEIINRATAEGVKNAEEMLRKMMEEGILFSPRKGFVQKV